MTSKPGKKSALAWIRANVASLPPSPFALQPEAAAVDPSPPQEEVVPQPRPPGSGAARPEPLPAAVEVWLELASRPERQAPGWAGLARNADRQGIMVTLNAAHRMVAKALQERDGETLAFLVALPLAETLLRRRREPFVAATLDRIRATLLSKGKREVSGWLSLSELLAGLPPLKAAAAGLAGEVPARPRLILAGEVPARPRLIFDVRLDAPGKPKA